MRKTLIDLATEREQAIGAYNVLTWINSLSGNKEEILEKVDKKRWEVFEKIKKFNASVEEIKAELDY